MHMALCYSGSVWSVGTIFTAKFNFIQSFFAHHPIYVYVKRAIGCEEGAGKGAGEGAGKLLAARENFL